MPAPAVTFDEEPIVGISEVDSPVDTAQPRSLELTSRRRKVTLFDDQQHQALELTLGCDEITSSGLEEPAESGCARLAAAPQLNEEILKDIQIESPRGQSVVDNLRQTLLVENGGEIDDGPLRARDTQPVDVDNVGWIQVVELMDGDPDQILGSVSLDAHGRLHVTGTIEVVDVSRGLVAHDCPQLPTRNVKIEKMWIWGPGKCQNSRSDTHEDPLRRFAIESSWTHSERQSLLSRENSAVATRKRDHLADWIAHSSKMPGLRCDF